MATFSAVPAVVNYLYTTFTAAVTLGGASPAVTIRVGPALGAFSPRVLWLAMDDPYGTQPSTPAGASSTQEWVGMPARQKNEDLIIDCCAESWSGSTDTVTAMNDAYTITAAVETLLLTDVGLGGQVLFQNPGVTNSQLRWHQGEGGAAAQVLFQITAKARLGN